MSIEANIPQDVIDAGNIVEGLEQEIRAWQDAYFAEHGHYTSLEDLSAMFDCPAGLASAVAYKAVDYGYYIRVRKTSDAVTTVTVTYPVGDGTAQYEIETSEWQRIIDYGYPENNESWRPQCLS